MKKDFSEQKIYRIIDANINRAKEGLRVCEEITRFILDNRLLTQEFKQLRHKISSLSAGFPGAASELLTARYSPQDVGKNIYVNELNRANCRDIFFANVQRAKESVRVLEEFAKLANKRLAVEFKVIRYAIYEVEKKSAKKILALSNFR